MPSSRFTYAATCWLKVSVLALHTATSRLAPDVGLAVWAAADAVPAGRAIRPATGTLSTAVASAARASLVRAIVRRLPLARGQAGGKCTNPLPLVFPSVLPLKSGATIAVNRAGT